MGGWVGGWVDLGLKLTQPPTGLSWAWVKLGNYVLDELLMCTTLCNFPRALATALEIKLVKYH